MAFTRPSASTTALVVVDVQERLLAAYGDDPALLAKVAVAIGGAVELGLPVIATEQYPAGLGKTMPEIAALFPAGTAVVEKTSFSCFDEPAFAAELQKRHITTLCLVGIEAHVCMQQTAFDALAKGYQTVVLADATRSRNAFDRDTALSLMLHNGVVVTTVESFLFGLTGGAKHPAFKRISKLVK